jgi:hypothetical protein
MNLLSRNLPPHDRSTHAWPEADRYGSASSVDAWPFHPPFPGLRLAAAEAPPGMEPEALADPFVTLGDRGGFSRVLLAEVRGAQDAPLLLVAVKLQSDEYPFLPEGVGVGLTCEDVESAWQREVDLLDRCGGAGSGIPSPVEVLERAPGAPALLPPTLYCKRRRAFFAAPCPACGGPLSDVRDDRLLESLGLPRRDRSLARFLGCSACQASGSTRLWALLKEADGGAAVQDAQDLFREFGTLARQPGRVLPCQGCEHVPRCYPENAAGEALRLLTPVTFYESRAVGLPFLHLRWDEAMQLAGGAEFATIVEGAATEPGRAGELRRLRGVLESQSAYVFEHDVSGKLGLEVLRLKLGLFAQLCRAVAALHRHARAPHLGITPGRVLVPIDPGPSGLPWLWRLGVRLVGLGNARSRTLPATVGDALPVVPYERPLLVDPVFAPPRLRETPLADLPAVATLLAVTPAGDANAVLELVIEADTVDLTSVSRGDLLDISIVQARPPLALKLVAVPTATPGRRLTVKTLPFPAGAGLRDTLAQLVGTPMPRTRFTVQACLHVPVDVHALGMMLLTGLLGHATRSPAAVAAAVQEVRQRILQRARDRGAEAGDGLVADAVGALTSDAFATRHLFADPEAHGAAAAALPEALWLDALLVGLRAVTWLRGFGICHDAADFDPQHPEVKTEFLLELVESLLRRVDAALFGLPGRGAEVRAALARIAREMKVE